MITVIHTPKSSSLAHSLQIYCTGLTGLRSYASWARSEKLDPTIIFILMTSLQPIGTIYIGQLYTSNKQIYNSIAPYTLSFRVVNQPNIDLGLTLKKV